MVCRHKGLTYIVTTQVDYCWLGVLFGAPRNLLVAQGRAKRRPGYCRPSPAFALQGQKHKSPRLLFVHTLHLLYMLLPLQGESAVVYSSPRAPLRSALGYEQVAPSGRTDGIIPPTISSQPNWSFRAKNDLSSYHIFNCLAPPNGFVSDNLTYVIPKLFEYLLVCITF